MGQQVLNLLRLVLPLALEQTSSVQSPFVYDLLPEAGEAVHRPSSRNLYSPGPTVWDWSLHGANGTTWRWEAPEGTWETWFWTAGNPSGDQGGGFRLRHMDTGDVWGELSWSRTGGDSLRWFCRLRERDPPGLDSGEAVDDMPGVEEWKIRSGDRVWGFLRKEDGAGWSFCTDEACVPLGAESCNQSVRSIRLVSEVGDHVDWEATTSGGAYRVVNVRVRRDSDGNFFSDLLDSVVRFFRRMFTGDSSRSGEDSSIMRLISAIIGLFTSDDSPATAAVDRGPDEDITTTGASVDLP